MSIKMPDKYWTGNPLFKQRLPWLTPGAINYLDQIVKPEMEVLEFGCGGSTLFFTDRNCILTSCESDKGWVKKVEQNMRHGAAVAWWPLELPKEDGKYDIVLVDNKDSAMSRQKLGPQALKKVKRGGWFILDNYARYNLRFLDGWPIMTFDDSHWDGKGTLFARFI